MFLSSTLNPSKEKYMMKDPVPSVKHLHGQPPCYEGLGYMSTLLIRNNPPLVGLRLEPYGGPRKGGCFLGLNPYTLKGGMGPGAPTSAPTA